VRAATRTTSITGHRSAPLTVAGHFTIPCMCMVLTSLFQTYVLVDSTARSILVDRAPRTIFVVSSCQGRSSPDLRWRFPTKKATHFLKNTHARNEILSWQNDAYISNRFARKILHFCSAQNRRQKTKKKSSKRVQSISPTLKYPRPCVSVCFLDKDRARDNFS